MGLIHGRNVQNLAVGRCKLRALSTEERKKAPNPENMPDLITPKNSVQRYAEDLTELDPNVVWGVTKHTPAVLPEDPSEIATLDTAQNADILRDASGKRKVLIRQMNSHISQQMKTQEETWIISYMDDG